VTTAAVLCAALVGLAALLALVVTARTDREHWPLAAALALYALDPLRPNVGAWALVLPALSAALAVAVLARLPGLAPLATAAVLACGMAELDRSAAPARALLLACGVGVAIQGIAALSASKRRLALADRCVLVLLAGDVAALAGPLGDAARWEHQAERWWLAQWQGAAVAAVLVVLHAVALRRRLA
jgi:hypothetical protein